ncbi:MAG: PKD domain-containing protein [Actinomycetota bacterium]|nr:PKD domain-containing protein [Actinomycetota bacterium]
MRVLCLTTALLLTLAGPAVAAPNASFRVVPNPPVEDQLTYFESTSTSTSTTDPAISVAIRRVQWDFAGGRSFEQSGNRVAHTYTSAGTKTFRMRVTDVLGVVTTESFTIGVSGLALPANRPPVAQVRFSPTSPLPGEEVLFESLSYDADGTVERYEWDFDGDGSADANTVQAVHSFTTPGTKTVRLVVYDNLGRASTPATVTFTVSSPPATRLAVAPAGPLLMYPFPVIRLAGSVTAAGARVRTLEVRAPVRSRITVRCAGTNCPAKRIAKTSRTRRVRFERMTRFLPAGTVITVGVRKGNLIGKYTRWRIRGGKLPKRTDRCLYPRRGTPLRCPLIQARS